MDVIFDTRFQTRTQLRRFWGRLLTDLKAGRTISQIRRDWAEQLAMHWRT